MQNCRPMALMGAYKQVKGVGIFFEILHVCLVLFCKLFFN